MLMLSVCYGSISSDDEHEVMLMVAGGHLVALIRPESGGAR